MNRSPEDLDFLAYQRTGSSDALARVFDTLAPRLLLLASHFTQDAHHAEDLVQTTFLQAMAAADCYDGHQPVARWLAGILRHRALDAKRKGGGRSTQKWKTQGDEATDPAKLLEDQEGFDFIVEAIEKLPAPFREVVALRVVHGIQPTAIAYTLGRAPGTVRMQLKRGLERLQKTVPRHSHCLAVLALCNSAGLSTAREAILAKATAPLAKAGSNLVTGLVMKKTLLGLGTTLLLVVPTWIGLRYAASPSPEEDPSIFLDEEQGRLPEGLDAAKSIATTHLIPGTAQPKRSASNGPSPTRLSILILDETTDKPVEGIPVGVTGIGGISKPKKDALHAQRMGKEGQYLFTDSRGLVEFEVEPGNELHGWAGSIEYEISTAPSNFLGTGIHLEALVEGESKTHTIRLKHRATGPFFARFVDANSGQPVEGVNLHTEGPTESNLMPKHLSWIDASQWRPTGSPLATSDLQGLIELEWHENATRLYEAHAPGYGPSWVETSRNSRDIPSATIIELRRTATLRGQLNPGRGQGFYLGIWAFPSMLSGQQENATGEDAVVWEPNTDSDGFFEIQNLPTSCNLQLWVEGSGGFFRELEEPLCLKPDEVREFNWTFQGGHTIQGVLLNDRGLPLPAEEVWLKKVPRKGPDDLHVSSRPYGDNTRNTDQRGHFEFRDLAPGIYLVGCYLGTQQGGYGRSVQVPPGASIKLQPPELTTIQGTVTCDGVPLEDVKVTNTTDNFHTVTDALGSFEIQCLRDRTVSLAIAQKTINGRQLVATARVTSRSGQRGVQLYMVPAVQVALEAVQASSGAKADVSFSIVSCDRAFGNVKSTGAKSSMLFSRLRPGRYVGWGRSADGRVGRTEVITLEPGQTTKPHIVKMRRGGSIEFTYPKFDKPMLICIWADGHRIQYLRISSPRKSITMPAGQYRVELKTYRSDEVLFEADFRVNTGQATSINIKVE